MIPQAYITEWSQQVPWKSNEQVEQDLVICRALVEIFSDDSSHITTYRLEELLGTKLRALYQRRKGRDLYDIFIALTQKPDLDIDALLHSYREYMNFSVEKPPTQREYLLNLEDKMQDSEFLGDTTALLRPDVPYDPQVAWKLVKTTLIEQI